MTTPTHAAAELVGTTTAPAPLLPAELRKAVQEAYGWLWHVNQEPMAPIPMWEPEKAAYQARKCLRELLTTAERGEAINAIAAHIDKIAASDGTAPLLSNGLTEAETAATASVAGPAGRTLLEQYDREQLPGYRAGYEDGRLKGYEVGHRHATERAAPQAEPVCKHHNGQFCGKPGPCLSPHCKPAHPAPAVAATVPAVRGLTDAACQWGQEDDGSSTYWSACGHGHGFTFNDGGPTDNGLKHCCYCGKPLIELPWVEPEPDAGIPAPAAREGE